MTPPTQQPGWYPDPWGEGAQRYFDGTNWGPAAPAAAAPPPLKPKPARQLSGKQVLLALAGVVGFLALVATCSNDDKKSDSITSRTSSAIATTTAKASTPTSSSSVQAAPLPPPTPTGPQKPDATTFTSSEGPGGQTVTATFEISDNITEGFIKAGARYKTIEILKYADATYPNAAQVTVVGSFPMEDAYGNTSTDEVINITYLRSTLDKINFDGVDKDKIWELMDSGSIAPAFRP